MDQPKKRLVVVSNRLPLKLVEEDGKISPSQTDGGLISALKSYFDNPESADEFEEKLWIGTADFSEKRWKKFQALKSPAENFRMEPVFIDTKLYNKYYNGFCNGTLWPLMHYFPSFTLFEADAFAAYEQINQLFEEKLASLIQPTDLLWIHDYHLFLLPQLVRNKFPRLSIGFFLHIPFPTFEIFRLLHRSWKEKIIRGMLGADLIGFHTHEYVQHFLKTVRMVLGYDHQFRTIPIGNRVVKADLFPLGIDYEKFHRATVDENIADQKNSILKNFAGKKIIFSVDRLDYTKGVTHRLTGFERFLEMHPEWTGKIVFILVVVPSRQIISKYNERKNLIEEQIGSINGKYSTLEWQPIIYRYSHLDFNELSALYQAADVALITPLRDGMNLVAKEFIASRVGQRGVLILSELAGAANELGEALLVNPMDKDELAHALDTALTMPAADQRQKMSLMQKRLIDYNVMHWVKDFLSQLTDIKLVQASRQTKFLNGGIREEIVSKFQQASLRHLFLDYDGTLVPFARHPREAKPGNRLIRLLELLGADSKNVLTIISGRDSSVLNEWFGNLPLNLVAEHGASIKRKGQSWTQEMETDESWKPLVRPTLDLFVQRCPGSFVEEKNHTLAWHYRNVEDELGFIRSRELLDSLMHLVRNVQLQLVDGNKVIEVRVTGFDKGAAARKLFAEHRSDFALAIGDDKTDEDMFHEFEKTATTIKVGPGVTQAQYILPSHEDVIELLCQFV